MKRYMIYFFGLGILVCAGFLLGKHRLEKEGTDLFRQTWIPETEKMDETSSEAESRYYRETERQTEEACGTLRIVIPGGNPEVKVMICPEQNQGKYHEHLTLRCSSDYLVSYGDVQEQHKASEPVWFTLEDEWLTYGAVTLTPLEKSGAFILADIRNDGQQPLYHGYFVVEKEPEGIKLVNVLPLEEYLCGVVPSEMPADYPMEALKAQAVCARTYALRMLQEQCQMDDSVDFQVYNRVAGNERTRQAVAETRGQVMMKDGHLADALYYSTSCGVDLAKDCSEESVFCLAMADVGISWEKDIPWYRWSVFYSMEELSRLAENAGYTEIGTVTGMQVAAREKNGRVSSLLLTGTVGDISIDGEYQIRKFLQTDQAAVTLQDGSQTPDLSMLPSAFFYLTPSVAESGQSGYTLTGGGYGHGNGMSQNGAKGMAEAGKNWQEILDYYYGKAIKK